MDGKFTLEIDMGNAAMLSRRDLARALEALAEKARSGDLFRSMLPGDSLNSGKIRDENGNTVGAWHFVEEK